VVFLYCEQGARSRSVGTSNYVLASLGKRPIERATDGGSIRSGASKNVKSLQKTAAEKILKKKEKPNLAGVRDQNRRETPLVVEVLRKTLRRGPRPMRIVKNASKNR